MTDRLYRSPDDRVIAGVAGGLATWLKIDPSLVRIAWVLLAIFTGGIFVLVYFVMMIVVPLPPAGWVPQAQGTATPGAVPGWSAGATPSSGPGPTPWGPGAAPAGSPPPSWGQPTSATGTPGPAPASPPAWNPAVAGNAGIVGGAILIILGVWFLVDQYIHINWELVWPVVVIVLGAVMIGVAARRGRIT